MLNANPGIAKCGGRQDIRLFSALQEGSRESLRLFNRGNYFQIQSSPLSHRNEASMAELIQIVASVVSLARELVEAFKVVRSTYKNAQGFDQLLDSLTLSVEVELQRLQLWGGGLDADSFESSLSAVIERLLDRIDGQLKDLKVFMGPYASDIPSDSTTGFMTRLNTKSNSTGKVAKKVTLTSRAKFVLVDQEK
jgi:hypothetical protein